MAQTKISNQPLRQQKPKATPRKLADLHLRPATKTDLPEYIKSHELVPLYPFTIYDAREKGGDYGARIFFSVAYKNEKQETVKRVWTPSANDERQQLMREVKRSPIVGCRLIEVPTNGRYDYFKVISVDDNPEEIIQKALAEIAERNAEETGKPVTSDDEIPF